MRPCLKQLTHCRIVRADGRSYEATNQCAVDSLTVCPRVTAGCPTGEGYELCGSTHAEANVALLAAESADVLGEAFLTGHTWLCKACQDALRAVNVHTFHIEGQIEMTQPESNAEVLALREALRKIARGPAMPLPDPGAHSWQAYGRAAMAALHDGMWIARNALLAGQMGVEGGAQGQCSAVATSSGSNEQSAVASAGVDALEEALRPFAQFSSGFGRTARDDDWVLITSPSGKRVITMGDVRLAEDLLTTRARALKPGQCPVEATPSSDLVEARIDASEWQSTAEQCRAVASRMEEALRELVDYALISNSYGVPDSGWIECRVCGFGGAPGHPVGHMEGCPVPKAEAVIGKSE